MAMVPFLRTNLKRQSWLYPGFAANIFWKHQSPTAINGRFHGMEIITVLGPSAKPKRWALCSRIFHWNHNNDLRSAGRLNPCRRTPRGCC